MDNSLSLSSLKNTQLANDYAKLISGKALSSTELSRLFGVAIIMLHQKDVIVRNFGYRIILRYSLMTRDFRPLYETAFALGYMPIVNSLLEQNELFTAEKKNPEYELGLAISELYSDGEKHLTEQQRTMRDFFLDLNEQDIVIIAPTSYGKTELVLSILKKLSSDNVCVIVPTKSLVAQTRSRVASSIDAQTRIITHPDMALSSSKRNVAILTQERALKLLRLYPDFAFDTVVIDEAHSLLPDEGRSLLLANAIALLRKRNPKAVFRYLTPFLFSAESLEPRFFSALLKAYTVTESLKMERLYIFDETRNRPELKEYDPYTNSFYERETSCKQDLDLIGMKGGLKSIVYLNKPADVERFAKRLLDSRPKATSDLIERICTDLKEYAHPDYLLIDCIRHGFAYHHGSMPENIRQCVEHFFSVDKACSLIVTTSTLLEGVNLPADKLFILDNRKGRSYLSSAALKNLLGRVCRFSEIFSDKESLGLLEPEIFFIKGRYTRKDANLESFIQRALHVSKERADIIKNVALKNCKTTSSNALQRAEEQLENFEPGTIASYKGRKAQTRIGELCFQNNINDIDIFELEQELANELEPLASDPLRSPESLLNVISQSFAKRSINRNIGRLQNQKAIDFYAKVLTWRTHNTPFSYMIRNFFSYWRTRSEIEDGPFVYVGSRWGEEKRGGHAAAWIDPKKKTDKELINLAIVRVQEEQNFIDYELFKYIDILNDAGYIDVMFYNLLRYRTTDEFMILLLKNGFSPSLAGLIIDKYRKQIELHDGIVTVSNSLINLIQENNENIVLQIESSNYLSPK